MCLFCGPVVACRRAAEPGQASGWVTGTPLSAWKAMVPTTQGRSAAWCALSSHPRGAGRDQQVSRAGLGGRGHTHTYTWAHTRVRAPPGPALSFTEQQGHQSTGRGTSRRRGRELGEAQGRRGGPGASKSGFSPVQQAMGSRGTHPDLRLPPLPQLHPSSGRRGQAGLVFAFGEVLHLKQKPPGLSWTSCPATNRPRRPATASAGHSGDSLFSSARWGDRAGSAGCWCRCHVTVWTRVSACGSKCSADVQWELFFLSSQLLACVGARCTRRLNMAGVAALRVHPGAYLPTTPVEGLKVRDRRGHACCSPLQLGWFWGPERAFLGCFCR